MCLTRDITRWEGDRRCAARVVGRVEGAAIMDGGVSKHTGVVEVEVGGWPRNRAWVGLPELNLGLIEEVGCAAPRPLSTE